MCGFFRRTLAWTDAGRRFLPAGSLIFLFLRFQSISLLSGRLDKSLPLFHQFVARSLLFLQRLIQEIGYLFFAERLSHLDNRGVARNLIVLNARSVADDQDVSKRCLLVF